MLLGLFKLTCQECIDVYEQLSLPIFSKHWGGKVYNLVRNGKQYEHKDFEVLLKEEITRRCRQLNLAPHLTGETVTMKDLPATEQGPLPTPRVRAFCVLDSLEKFLPPLFLSGKLKTLGRFSS